LSPAFSNVFNVCMFVHIAIFQGPTGPLDAYDLFLELLQCLDKDAVRQNPDYETAQECPLVRLENRPYPAGVELAVDESVNMNQLQPLLRLPYQDMKVLLTDVLRNDVLRKQVRHRIIGCYICSLLTNFYLSSGCQAEPQDEAGGCQVYALGALLSGSGRVHHVVLQAGHSALLVVEDQDGHEGA
jgi:hypothetical protein